MHAETAYLFRHAILRDAAYEVQLPSARATLHRTVAELIQAMPGPDAFAGEISDHLYAARRLDGDRSHVAEEIQCSDQAAEQARWAYENELAVMYWMRVAELADDEQACAARGKAALVIARTARVGQAIEMFRQNLEQHRSAGRREGEALELARLASALQGAGDSDEALRRFEEAFVISDELQLEAPSPYALKDYALACSTTGKMQQAEDLLRRAIQSAKGSPDAQAIGAPACNLANICIDQARYDEARELLEVARKAALELRDKRAEGIVIALAGRLLSDTGEPEKAQEHYEASLKLAQQTGNRIGVAANLNCLAACYFAKGDKAKTIEVGEQALELAQEIGAVGQEGLLLGNLAAMYSDAGELEKAERAYAEALRIHRRASNRHYEGLALLGYACHCVLTGRRDEGAQHWQRGRGILKELGVATGIQGHIDAMREGCEAQGVQPFE